MNCWIILLLLCGCGSGNGNCGRVSGRCGCTDNNCNEPRDMDKKCDDNYERERENRWSPYRNSSNCEHHDHDHNSCDCDR